MNRISLFGRYWFYLAALVTFPIVAAGLVEGYSVYHATRNAALDRQKLEARQAAFYVERSVVPSVERLAIIADVPWDYPSATSAEQRADLKRLIRQFPLFDRIQRVDSSGAVVDVTSQDGRKRPLAN